MGMGRVVRSYQVTTVMSDPRAACPPFLSPDRSKQEQ